MGLPPQRGVGKVEWYPGELLLIWGFIMVNLGPGGLVEEAPFVANRVRLALFVLDYNLRHFLWRLGLLKAIKMPVVTVWAVGFHRPHGE